MRKLTVAALVLGLGASYASADAPISVRGSDTIFGMTQRLITACGIPASSLVYEGGGSGGGEAQIETAATPPASQQIVAPMSRFIDGPSCGRAAPRNKGMGCAAALDGVAIWREVDGVNGCDTMRYTGSMTVQDLNGVAGLDDGAGGSVAGTYNFTNWRDVLRIVYGGQAAGFSQDSCLPDAPGSGCPTCTALSTIDTKRCNSDIRRTLVENWGQMFQNPGCQSSETCTKLWHAFRRDDISGTTETFTTLLGMPAANAAAAGGQPAGGFCNGTEFQENDPIRRGCPGNGVTNGEQVCQSTNLAKLQLFNTTTQTLPDAPGANPTIARQGDLGLILPIIIPDTDAYPPANRLCAAGTFDWVLMPAASGVNALCPNGTPRRNNNCLMPQTAAHEWGCIARFNSVASPPTIGNADGRGYNKYRLRPDGTFITVRRGTATAPSNIAIQFAWYMAHVTTVMNNPNPPATGTTVDTNPPAAGVSDGPGCAEVDSTDQIGCLVNASPCSLGFAGLAADTSENVALKMSEADGAGETGPTVPAVQLLADTGTCPSANPDRADRYPLSRKLFLNTMIGFDAVQALLSSSDVTQSSQAELTQCYCDRFYTDPATKAEGFVLPGADTCGSDRPGTMPGVAACEAQIVTCPGVTPESVF